MKYYIAVLVILGVIVAAREIAGVIAERDDEKQKRNEKNNPHMKKRDDGLHVDSSRMISNGGR